MTAVAAQPATADVSVDSVGFDRPVDTSDAHVRSTRIARAMPWLVAALVLTVGLLLVNGLPVGVVHDDGQYVILAKSLATGHGYRWIDIPGMPPATHFPPGYPAILAVVWKLFPSFPQNAIAFKILNAVFLAAIGAGIVVFARRRLNMAPWSAAAIAVAGCLAVPTLVLSTLVMSEPCFLALTLFTLLLAERVVARPAAPWMLVALALLVAAATLVRTHGIVLVPAVALMLATRRRWRDAALYAAVAVVALVPWQLWMRTHQGFVPQPMRGNYESYTGWLVRAVRVQGLGLVARTVQHTSFEIIGMVGTFAGAMLPWIPRLALSLLVLALCFVGLWRLWRGAPVTALFVVFYFAIVLVWPFTPARFVWGVWPLLTLLPVLGVAALWRWWPTNTAWRASKVLALAAVAVAAFGYARYNWHGYRGQWWSSIPRSTAASVAPLVNWTLLHTAPTDVVASNAEPPLYLYTGRRTLPAASFTVDEYFHPVSVAASAQALRGILAGYHVDALAVVGDDSLAVAAERMAASKPPELAPRDTFADGRVYTPVSAASK